MSLETQLAEHTKQDADNFAKLNERFDKLEEQFKLVHDELTRYKGFVGGVVWVVGALFAVAVTALELLRK